MVNCCQPLNKLSSVVTDAVSAAIPWEVDILVTFPHGVFFSFFHENIVQTQEKDSWPSAQEVVYQDCKTGCW